MATIRYKKRGERWYVYQLEQYWDKELKKPRQRTTYLGVAETKGGEYRKTGRMMEPRLEKEMVDYGDSFTIDAVSSAIGLKPMIEEHFDHLDSIMTLLSFQIVEGAALCHCEAWREGNIAKRLYPAAMVSSQSISRLLRHLGRQELQTRFFKHYIRTFFPQKTGLLIDSTALPSAINTSLNGCGYAGGIIEPNVTCLTLVDTASKLPIYFRAIGGDIADISTLKVTVTEMQKLGLEAHTAILDAGFCSKENLQFLCEKALHFITRLPKHHKAFSDMIEQAGGIETSRYAVAYGNRVVFLRSQQVTLYDCQLYAHIVLDPSKKSRDTLTLLKDQLDHPLTETDQNALDKKMRMAGFFILLSNHPIEAKEVLPHYYTRQSIEQLFGFAKHNASMLPLRVHDETAIRGYIMLVFLALIVFVTMYRSLKQPMDQVLLSLRGLKAKLFDDAIVPQEPNKKQKAIFKALNVIMPT